MALKLKLLGVKQKPLTLKLPDNIKVDLGSKIFKPITITQNGVYKGGVEEGLQVGYTPINVNVQPNIQPINITENGTYTATEIDGYNPVMVDVKTNKADVIKELISFRRGNASNLFAGATNRTIEEWNEIVKYDTTEEATNLQGALNGIANDNWNVTLRTLPLFDTRNCTNFHSFALYNQTIYEIPAYDLRSGENFNNAFAGINAYQIWVKNIKASININNSSRLEFDCLIHLIRELRDTGSAKTLTVGATNLAKIADTYVKLITITDEMREQDDLIDEKLPFEVCESTDEGAMLITEYVLQKNWQIAG